MQGNLEDASLIDLEIMVDPKDWNVKQEDIERMRKEKILPEPNPQPHRCNDRVEDLIQALYTLEFGTMIRPAWRNMRACFKSEKG